MIAAVNSSQLPHAGCGRSHALQLQEIRSDIGLFLDRIIIGNAVGDQRSPPAFDPGPHMSCASQMVWPPQSGASTTCDTTRNPFRSSNERYSAGSRLA